MTYSELLQPEEWKTKRNLIVERDKNTCQNCLNKKYLEKHILPFKVKPYINRSKILIDDFPVELIVNKKFTYFLSLKKNPKEPILIILDVIGEKTQIVGFCVLNTAFTDDEFEKENEKLIDLAIDKVKEFPRRQAVKQYLMSFPIDYAKIKKELSLKYINNNISQKASINWFDLKNLHVHHKYYQKKKLPWEYPNEALVTLCWDCHEALHKDQNIPILNENGKEIGKLKPCQRCFGAGYFPEYHHVHNGICFECNGAKYKEL